MQRRPCYFACHFFCEKYCILCYYAASIDYSLPTFRDNLSVPSLRLKNPYCSVLTRKSAVLVLFADGSLELFIIFVNLTDRQCLKN
jgi:hypothetical protein